jgi:hypothetical protein
LAAQNHNATQNEELSRHFIINQTDGGMWIWPVIGVAVVVLLVVIIINQSKKK